MSDKLKNYKRPKATTSKNHYINNAQLLPEVKRAKELGYITDELARMFMLLTERISTKSWYAGYSYRDDMVASALLNLCANGLKFDTDKYSNPYAYYTTAIMRSFSHYKSYEKNQRNIRDMMLIDAGANPSSTFVDGAHDEFRENNSDFFDH